ncbi:MAG: recombination protein RecR [Flavobacteriales bacterium]|nr:recombination protein RecR [Flavobacteriales bacterium]MCB9168649.1 recombination protein RecR [Flavobacteriales bacterium]
MPLSSVLLENAVDQLSTLPGIGRRTAMRMALDLLRRDGAAVHRFTEAVRRMRDEIQYCSTCCNISDRPVCEICSAPGRERGTICVVEDISAVIAIENTHRFKGLYHVLGGVISPMDGVGPEDLQIARLLERVAEGGVEEVILALSATLEGDTTSFFLNKRLGERGIRVSVIARGISVGGDLEHVDELTLGRSIMDRKPYEEAVRR